MMGMVFLQGTDLRKVVRSDRVDMREDWEV